MAQPISAQQSLLMHQSIPAAPSPPGWPLGISIFCALDGKFPGVGTLELLSCQIPQHFSLIAQEESGWKEILELPGRQGGRLERLGRKMNTIQVSVRTCKWCTLRYLLHIKWGHLSTERLTYSELYSLDKLKPWAFQNGNKNTKTLPASSIFFYCKWSTATLINLFSALFFSN